VCHSTLIPLPSFLAPVDLGLSIPGVSCTLQAHADLAELGEEYAKSALEVLTYLLSLP
jgi:hypothetical protein